MGEVNERAVARDDANLLGALSRMGAAAITPLYFGPVFNVGAGGPPSGIWALKAFVPWGVVRRSDPRGGRGEDAAR